MKKVITLLLVALMATTTLLFVACGVSVNKDLEQVKQNGVLRVGMEAGYAPFNWRQSDDSNGAVKIVGMNYYANGYDVAIAKEIASDLGVELEIYALEWGALIPSLTAGSVDCIIAGMSPTAERKETVDFSNQYFESNLVVVVRKDGEFANATNLSDLDTANIVAQIGTYHLDALGQLCEVTSSQRYDTFPLMITALNSKTIDGYIAEEPGAISDCQANSSFKYIPLVNNDTGFDTRSEDTQLGVAVRKNSTLTVEINRVLEGIDTATRQTLMNTAIDNAPTGE